MSSRCLAAVFERYPRASSGEFVLALVLADNAQHDGVLIFSSGDAMAHKSRQSVHDVQRHLRKMQAAGWLIKVCSGGERGRHTKYRIDPDWLGAAAPAEPALSGRPAGQRVPPGDLHQG